MNRPDRKAREGLLRLITGFWVSQAIYVAARLKLADAIDREARSARYLAERVGASPAMVTRVLRALVEVGVVREDPPGRFSLDAMGHLLRAGPGSLRSFALLMMEDGHWKALGALFRGVKHDSLPFRQVHGCRSYEYLARHPRLEKLLVDMQRGTEDENGTLARAFRFGRFGTLVDVGGSGGHLLAGILRRYQKMKGVLFDLPQVVRQAKRYEPFRRDGIRSRVQFAGGDFFKGVPDGADAYLLRFVLHNWNDEQCVRILRNCRKAMSREGSVLILEHEIRTDSRRGDFTRIGDIGMLALTGGRERTHREYERLLEAAGLKLQRVTPAPSPLAVATPLSIIEAVRA